MNEQKWRLIMATPVPSTPLPSPYARSSDEDCRVAPFDNIMDMRIESNGTDTTRQLRAVTWMNGHVTLTLTEVMELTDV
mgnify:CR=1 FL=1